MNEYVIPYIMLAFIASIVIGLLFSRKKKTSETTTAQRWQMPNLGMSPVQIFGALTGLGFGSSMLIGLGTPMSGLKVGISWFVIIASYGMYFMIQKTSRWPERFAMFAIATALAYAAISHFFGFDALPQSHQDSIEYDMATGEPLQFGFINKEGEWQRARHPVSRDFITTEDCRFNPITGKTSKAEGFNYEDGCFYKSESDPNQKLYPKHVIEKKIVEQASAAKTAVTASTVKTTATGSTIRVKKSAADELLPVNIPIATENVLFGNKEPAQKERCPSHDYCWKVYLDNNSVANHVRKVSKKMKICWNTSEQLTAKRIGKTKFYQFALANSVSSPVEVILYDIPNTEQPRSTQDVCIM